MRGQNRRLHLALFLALAVIVYWLGPFSPDTPRPAFDEGFFDELLPEEMQENRYYRMVDEDGRTIVTTGRRLRPGDAYLSADNRFYEVFAVEGYLARARFKEEVKFDLPMDSPAAETEDPPGLLPAQQRPAYRIAIYHSHNAESYVPSDGTDSIYGRGGIHDVGVAFRDALEGKGIEVLYSERLHLPHDRGAYRRSRVTAQQLLQQRPDAIFDVHRDAAPWEAYSMEIDGELITQIQFVVGLSNPGAAANRNFAFDLKGQADRVRPGVVRGVFLIWGGYNQDLSPMSLLLEVGAHTNSKEAAVQGITLFADAVAYYFYGPGYLEEGRPVQPGDEDEVPPALYRDAGGISSAISGTVLGLLLTSLGAALGFYFLNNPGALEKLYHWWEHLPERAAAFPEQVKLGVSSFPALAKQKWAEFPGNLLEAWHQLGDEIRDLPAWTKIMLEKGLHRGAGTGRAAGLWLRRLPGNWRLSWRLFTAESRAFPGYLRRRAARGRAALGRAAVWTAGAALSAWRRLVECLHLARGRAAGEAAHLAALIREKITLLFSRLRS